MNNLSFTSFDLIDGIIVFIISEIKFCLDIKYVSKILAPEVEYSVITINKIDNVKLMSNNEMIPLINFHTLYGLTIPQENSNNRLFLLDYENHRIAFLVDRVKEIITINKGIQDTGFSNTNLLNILLQTSELIFSKDQVITETLESVGIMRKRNKEILLLKYFSTLTSLLKKTRKTINFEQKTYHCYYYLSTYIAPRLANLILLLNNKLLSYELKAIEKVGGQTDQVVQSEKKEETPKEYNDRIEKEISEGKHGE